MVDIMFELGLLALAIVTFKYSFFYLNGTSASILLLR